MLVALMEPEEAASREPEVLPNALVLPKMVSSNRFDGLWDEEATVEEDEAPVDDGGFASEVLTKFGGVALANRNAPIMGPLLEAAEIPKPEEEPEAEASEPGFGTSPVESRSRAGLRASVHPPEDLSLIPVPALPDAPPDRAPEPRRFALNMLNAVPVVARCCSSDSSESESESVVEELSPSSTLDIA